MYHKWLFIFGVGVAVRGEGVGVAGSGGLGVAVLCGDEHIYKEMNIFWDLRFVRRLRFGGGVGSDRKVLVRFILPLMA